MTTNIQKVSEIGRAAPGAASRRTSTKTSQRKCTYTIQVCCITPRRRGRQCGPCHADRDGLDAAYHILFSLVHSSASTR